MITKHDQQDFKSYLEDTSGLKGNSSSLYIPESKEELACIVKELVDKKTPFTISAGRTGTTGGCVPLEGVLISLENLKRIIDIDKKEKRIYLETGVTLQELEKEINPYNLTLRATPTEGLAFIGGAISTCASGVRGVKYGSIRNYIQAIEVLLPTGEVICIKRGKIFSQKRKFDFELAGRKFKFNLPSYTLPSVKSQAGYYARDDMDFIDVFVGSEGTLGVVLATELALQGIASYIFDGLIFFEKELDALKFVNRVQELKSKQLLSPTSVEFFDSNSLKMLAKEYSFVPKSPAAIYFEQELEKEEEAEACMDRWISLVEECNGLLDKSILADTPKERERVFNFRHKLPEMINDYLSKHKQLKVATDIAVPQDKFASMYDFYKKVGESSKIPYVNFGHIGESHLHFNFLARNQEENKRTREYLKTFCEEGVSLGGTVSAEHGIGKIKKPYLKIMYNNQEIGQMVSMKKYFDPHCLMGLDNIFEKDLLISG